MHESLQVEHSRRAKLRHADACITDAVYGTCQHASDPKADSQPTVRPWTWLPNEGQFIVGPDMQVVAEKFHLTAKVNLKTVRNRVESKPAAL